MIRLISYISALSVIKNQSQNQYVVLRAPRGSRVSRDAPPLHSGSIHVRDRPTTGTLLSSRIAEHSSSNLLALFYRSPLQSLTE